MEGKREVSDELREMREEMKRNEERFKVAFAELRKAIDLERERLDKQGQFNRMVRNGMIVVLATCLIALWKMW